MDALDSIQEPLANLDDPIPLDEQLDRLLERIEDFYEVRFSEIYEDECLEVPLPWNTFVDSLRGSDHGISAAEYAAAAVVLARWKAKDGITSALNLLEAVQKLCVMHTMRAWTLSVNGYDLQAASAFAKAFEAFGVLETEQWEWLIDDVGYVPDSVGFMRDELEAEFIAHHSADDKIPEDRIEASHYFRERLFREIVDPMLDDGTEFKNVNHEAVVHLVMKLDDLIFGDDLPSDPSPSSDALFEMVAQLTISRAYIAEEGWAKGDFRSAVDQLRQADELLMFLRGLRWSHGGRRLGIFRKSEGRRRGESRAEFNLRRAQGGGTGKSEQYEAVRRAVRQLWTENRETYTVANHRGDSRYFVEDFHIQCVLPAIGKAFKRRSSGKRAVKGDGITISLETTKTYIRDLL